MNKPPFFHFKYNSRVIPECISRGSRIFVLLSFFFTSVNWSIPTQASEFFLPKPGVRVHTSLPFNPAILKGLKVHPDNPFKFDFILDSGDTDVIPAKAGIQQQEQLKQQANTLIKYFLASITVPDKDLWVNLSPYEKERIIPDAFGQTEMGRDLLAQDYLLKQITASFMHPEDETGKKFWKRIYEESAQKFGTTNVPINTFNKVWIVPEKAVVYENAKAGTVYVVESKLKVMLESDYLAQEKNQGQPGDIVSLGAINAPIESVSPRRLPSDQLLNARTTQGINGSRHQVSQSIWQKQIVHEIIIPELEKEINQGKNFAQLRQVYNSLILAQWYKKKIKQSLLSKIYTDKNKIKGTEYVTSVIASAAKQSFNDQIASSSSNSRSSSTLPSVQAFQPRASQVNPHNDVDQIYQQYLKAFKKGAVNLIKEEQDPITRQNIPRKYFSGGAIMGNVPFDYAKNAPANPAHAQMIQVALRSDQAMKTLSATEVLKYMDNYYAALGFNENRRQMTISQTWIEPGEILYKDDQLALELMKLIANTIKRLNIKPNQPDVLLALKDFVLLFSDISLLTRLLNSAELTSEIIVALPGYVNVNGINENTITALKEVLERKKQREQSDKRPVAEVVVKKTVVGLSLQGAYSIPVFVLSSKKEGSEDIFILNAEYKDIQNPNLNKGYFRPHARYRLNNGVLIIDEMQADSWPKLDKESRNKVRDWNFKLLHEIKRIAKDLGVNTILFTPPQIPYQTWKHNHMSPVAMYRQYSKFPYDNGFRLVAKKDAYRYDFVSQRSTLVWKLILVDVAMSTTDPYVRKNRKQGDLFKQLERELSNPISVEELKEFRKRVEKYALDRQLTQKGKHSLLAIIDFRLESYELLRIPLGRADKAMSTTDPLATLDDEFRLPKVSRAKQRTSNTAKGEKIAELDKEFGFLPPEHVLHRFVWNRLRTILPDIQEDELPNVHVLAKRGFGINALVFPEGDIVVSPELLAFIRYKEELDGILMHELAHTALKHSAAIESTVKGRAIKRSLGILRIAEYEADTYAFYRLQEPNRHSNALGLLIAFERLRRAGVDGWDFAHGDITDRILNLKILMRDLNILGTDQMLVSIREFWDDGELGKAVSQLPLLDIEIESQEFSNKTNKRIKIGKKDTGDDEITANVNAILVNIGSIMSNTGRDLLRNSEALDLFREAIQEIRRIKSRELRERLSFNIAQKFDFDFSDFEKLKNAFQILQALAEDANHLAYLIDSSLEPKTRIDLDFMYEDFHDFTNRLYNVAVYSNPFGSVSSDVQRFRLEDSILFQENAFQSLIFLINNTTDALKFVNIVTDYLKRWKVPTSSINEENQPTTRNIDIVINKKKLLNKGLAFMGEVDVNELMLLMSFFISDIGLQYSVRQRALTQLIERNTFADALNLVFDDYAVQHMFIGPDIIHILDKKAQTPQEFSELLQASARLRERILSSSEAIGNGILEEVLMKAMLEQINPQELFSALIESQQDDSQLKKILFNVWWDVYRWYIGRDINEGKINKEILSFQDLEQWSREGISSKSLEEWIDESSSHDINTSLGKKTKLVEFIPFKSFVERIYRMKTIERYILIRKLLVGEKGILNTAAGRKFIITILFNTYINDTSESQLSLELKRILWSFVDSAPKDEVYLTLAPLLQGLIANAPERLLEWPRLEGPKMDHLRNRVFTGAEDDFVSEHLGRDNNDPYASQILLPDDEMSEIDLEEDNRELDVTDHLGTDIEMDKVYDRLLAQKLSFYIQGGLKSTQDVEHDVYDAYIKFAEGSTSQNKAVKLTPMRLILQAAQQMGTPGVRFLQLLGQTVDLPPAIREEFSQVYDSMHGQTKLAAWQTIQQYLPDYAKRVKRIIRRMGGGSMYSVFEVEIEADATDYPDRQGQLIREAVRVLNPNALYRARNSIDIIRDTIDDLATDNSVYEQAKPLVDLLEQWVEKESADQSFNEQDKQFRDQWHQTNPSTGILLKRNKWRGNIYVPRSIPTGTVNVWREELIDQVTNLTALKTMDQNQAKEAVSMAVRFYIAQITGGWKAITGLTKDEVLLHSDISPGNLGVKPNGDLVIFDRGFYLTFNRSERVWLNQLAQAPDLTARIRKLVNHLLTLPENQQLKNNNIENIVQEIIKEVTIKQEKDEQQISIHVNTAIAKGGIKAPLKYTLLFKNMNALNHLSKEAGFKSISEALAYAPDQAMIENKQVTETGGVDLTSDQKLAIINGDDSTIELNIDPALLKQFQQSPGFTPVIINIQPMTNLQEFLGV